MGPNVYLLSFLSFTLLLFTPTLSRPQWTVEQAKEWHSQHPWFIGCNFIPSTAVNTLEMWQAETYDPTTIDRELGYAQGLGFNIIRVFLHYLVWQENPDLFKARLDNFLQIATSHNISTMFVLFDDCWNPEGYLGPQPAPIPGVHNSRWVQVPGQAEYTNTSLFPIFQEYITDIIGSFNNDTRVVIWDIYNEPGNSDHKGNTYDLLNFTLHVAQAANPSQPITAGIYDYTIDKLNAFQLTNSDIVTFHTYDSVEHTKTRINLLKTLTRRPLICTEYMARPMNSTFETHVPLFYEEGIGCINWGLVSGKTQTIYPWGSPEGAPPPKIWFHDIFYPNGTAFDPAEPVVIKNYTGAKNRNMESHNIDFSIIS